MALGLTAGSQHKGSLNQSRAGGTRPTRIRLGHGDHFRRHVCMIHASVICVGWGPPLCLPPAVRPRTVPDRYLYTTEDLSHTGSVPMPFTRPRTTGTGTRASRVRQDGNGHRSGAGAGTGTGTGTGTEGEREGGGHRPVRGQGWGEGGEVASMGRTGAAGKGRAGERQSGGIAGLCHRTVS